MTTRAGPATPATATPRPAPPRSPASAWRPPSAGLGEPGLGEPSLDEPDLYKHGPVGYLDRIRPDILEHRCAEGLPADVVKPPVVFGALDHPPHDQAVAQQRLLVRAVPVGRVVLVTGRPVDRVVQAVVRERDDVLRVDVVHPARGDPRAHHAAVLTAGSGRARPSLIGAGWWYGGASGGSSRRT